MGSNVNQSCQQQVVLTHTEPRSAPAHTEHGWWVHWVAYTLRRLARTQGRHFLRQRVFHTAHRTLHTPHTCKVVCCDAEARLPSHGVAGEAKLLQHRRKLKADLHVAQRGRTDRDKG